VGKNQQDAIQQVLTAVLLTIRFFLGCDAVSLDEWLTDVSEDHSHVLLNRYVDHSARQAHCAVNRRALLYL
jgi:hypothetical protein